MVGVNVIYSSNYGYMLYKLVEGSLEVKLPTICRDGKAMKSRGGKRQGGEVKK